MLRNMASSNIDQLEISDKSPAKYDASAIQASSTLKRKIKIKGLNAALRPARRMGQEPKANEKL